MKSLLAASALCLLLCMTQCGDRKSGTHPARAVKIQPTDTAGISLSSIDSLHHRITFKPYDKSLNEYILSNPNRPDSLRHTIYILPLGNMNPEIERIIREEVEYLKIFFQLDVKILDRLPFDDIRKMKKVKTRMFSGGYDEFGKLRGYAVDLTEQIEAKSMIDHYMVDHKPADAVAILGITEHDLYLPRYNYIYGVSYGDLSIGLVSTFRITGFPEESRINIRKVMSKQIANLFSIPNIKDYQCLLNFHKGIGALREGVLYISPRALEKLKFSIGFDYVKRFEGLKAFYEKEQNAEMAAYYSSCIRILTQHENTAKTIAP